MSKATHTPGPWCVNPDFAQVDAFEHDGSGQNPVCQLLWPTDVRSEDETEANANLISAAPDLLASLEDMVEVAKNESWLSETTWLFLQKRAKAAIAKAKGEA